MYKFILLLLFTATSLFACSQKNYFIYLQTEPGQPFFVKMNQRVYSSAATGYLILSPLEDTTYELTAGFPGDKWPEQHFSVTVGKKDHGYLLKNFEEKGWGLYDLETLVVQMSAMDKPKTENKETSIFAHILSKATADPSFEESINSSKTGTVPQPVEKMEPVNQEVNNKEDQKINQVDSGIKKAVDSIEISVVKKEETGNRIQEQLTGNVKETETPGEDEYKKSTVVKKSESSTTEGFGLTFIDIDEYGAADTIQLLIPNPAVAAVLITKEPEQQDAIPADTMAQKEEKKPVEAAAVAKSGITNICTDVADESDFLLLRKKMASSDNEEDMMDEAKKYFKRKCFTTGQIKNLGVLFLNDEGKYRFYDIAYPHSTDIENFASLQAELKDEYYINRFKAMLKQ